MSGVYINMEMPKSCPCELLGVGYDLICSFVGGIPCRVKEYYECCQNGTRPSWCPLVPVPPHGRCIDADAARKSIKPWSPEDEKNGCTFDTVKKLMHTMLVRAPTIIPAEPAEEGET